MNIDFNNKSLSQEQAKRLAEVIIAYSNDAPNETIAFCGSANNGKMAILELTNGVTIVSDKTQGIIYFAEVDKSTKYYDDYIDAIARQLSKKNNF